MANLPAYRLAAWFASPAGARVLREEAGPLTDAVRGAHGDTLLWLGCHQSMREAVRGSMVRNRLYGSVAAGRPPVEFPVLQCAYEELPVPNNSLDALVLHHALETAADPRSVLREAARAITPGGRLIVCTFNPVSLWGLRRLYARFAPDAFQGLQLLSMFRLLDWLALLGFETQGSPRYLQFGLPFQFDGASGARAAGEGSRGVAGAHEPNAAQRFLQRRRVPLGGVCLLSATKQAAAVRPLWRPAARLAPVAYGRPAFGTSKVIRLHVAAPRMPVDE